MEKYKDIRRAAGLSMTGIVKAIFRMTGKNITQSTVHRFECGDKTRDKIVAQNLRTLYKNLALQPAIKEVQKKPPGRPAPLVERLPRIHVKDGSVFSTPIDRAGIMSFPEGKYLLEINSRGTQIVPLATESNPLDGRVASIKSECEKLRAELEQYKKGHDAWEALKGLVKD